MNIDNNDKALLLNGGAATLSNIRLLDDEGHEFLINDDNYLAEWNYEDYSYVPENGFIGQFVERIFDGRLLDLPTDMSLEGKEIKPSLGVQDIQNSTTKYYDIGTFIVTDIGEKDKTGSYKFKSSDYTKKFNILYKDFGKYPCLSIELLNNVCEQVGVPYDNNGMCWCYAVTEDGVEAGPHCFEIDGTYYNFTLDNDLLLNDSLMYIEATNKLIQKRVIVEDNEYKVIRTEISFQTTSSSTVNQLLGSYIPYYDFTNNDFVIINNQFDEDELCRDVVKAVAKLAYTWARIGTDDKLHLDFTKKNVQDVDEYDIINTDRYYDNVTTGDTVAPINKVLIGMSQVDGENVYDIQNGDRIRLDKLNGETSQNGTPTPDAPKDVKVVTGDNTLTVCGKNLLDLKYLQMIPNTSGTIISNSFTSNVIIGTRNISSLYVSGDFTLLSDNALRIGTYNTYPTLGSTGTRLTLQANGTIDTSNVNYVLFAFVKTNGTTSEFETTVKNSFMINIGNTAAIYEPYKSQEYEINLGKNLVRDSYTSSSLNQYSNIFYADFDVKPNTTYTISFEGTEGNHIYSNELLFTNSTNFTIQNGRTKLTCTTKANISKSTATQYDSNLGMWIIFKNFTGGVTSPNVFNNIQIEEGPTATNYVPYFEPIELCKIGDYQDYITKNSGRNLCPTDFSYWESGHNAGDGTKASYPSRVRLKDLLPCKPSTVYYNNTGKQNFVIRTYDADKQFVRSIGGLQPGTTFTTGATEYYLGIALYDTAGDVIDYNTFQTQFNNGIQKPFICPNSETNKVYEPYGVGEWYLYKEFGKVNLSSFTWTANDMNVQNYKRYTTTEIQNVSYVPNNTTLGIGIAEKYTMHIGSGLSNVTNAICIDVSMVQVTDKSTNNPSGIFYYKLKVPTVTKITNQDLIDQLNTLNQNAITYDGNTYITVNTVNEKPSLNLTITDINQNSTTQTGKDISVVGHEYAESAIRIYDNPLTHNELLRKIALNGCERLFGLTYTPLTINTIGHPWLEGDSYVKLEDINERTLYTYSFNRKLTYKGYINSTITSIAENQVKQTYEYSKNMLYKITKTEIDVDKANNRITLLNKDVEDNYTKQSTFETTVSDITSTVKTIDDRTSENGPIVQQISQVQQSVNAIQNLFQITGGTNLIKNSAFLLNDDVWEFTNIGSGTHYHTPLGQGYNGSVIGSVVSKSQVQLKNIKMSSKIDSENIQVSLLNTQHSFTYAYKMDANTTATIKLIDTTTNTAVYEETLTPTNTITKMQFPPKPAEGEEQQIFTPTAINYKLEVETQTTQDGSVYLYDMMFNSGDFKPWEQSSGEITSTILKLSMLGLQVISTGSNVATVMNASGFAVYPIDSSGNIGANPITSFNNVGLITGEAETTKVTIEKYVMDELQLDGVEHHVEYFKE